ncbi:MAG TPA: glycosyltransferase [Pseudolabrys sp.]|jgi:glycosyltransferase involved in cell wall biosynthesis|nr:glycosyltransferase [Pseudolabrys sp.]
MMSASASSGVRQAAHEHSHNAIRVLIVAPALEAGAADAGAVELTRVLQHAGHHAIVVSNAGRLVADINAAGAEFVPLDVATTNPIRILRNVFALRKLARDKRCDCIHALGRSGAWSALIAARMTRLPFLTSWYKGFRDQNLFKHLYNGVMARGDRVVAVSEQLAQLVHDRYGTAWEKLTVVPCSVDLDRFDPERMTQGRIDAIRHAWGVTGETKVILVVGRILRRKGHHVVVKAVERLKKTGLKDFLCVFVGEDRGRTHYTGELWDLVLATGTMEVIRMAAPVHDMPAAYAAATVVVSAAIQPEGVQRAILEAQAMGRPMIVSDLAAGSDVVLTAPFMTESRVSGLRFPAGDDSRLAATLLRLLSIPAPMRSAMGARGRDWVLGHFNAEIVAEQTLRIYEEATGRPAAANAKVAA